jgi:hypothetical protein
MVRYTVIIQLILLDLYELNGPQTTRFSLLSRFTFHISVVQHFAITPVAYLNTTGFTQQVKDHKSVVTNFL